MTQCNSLSVKLSNSQLKLKSAIKNKTEIFLRLSSNMIGKSNDVIFHINYYQLMDKLQIFEKFSQIIHQMILSYQKLTKNSITINKKCN